MPMYVQSKASKESFLDLGPLVYAVFQNASPNTASRMTHFLSKVRHASAKHLSSYDSHLIIFLPHQP